MTRSAGACNYIGGLAPRSTPPVWAGGPSSVSVREVRVRTARGSFREPLNPLPGSQVAPWTEGCTAPPPQNVISQRILSLYLWQVVTLAGAGSVVCGPRPHQCQPVSPYGVGSVALVHGHVLVELCDTAFVGASVVINPGRLRGARTAHGHLQESRSLLP